MNYIISSIKPKHINHIVKIHLAAFPNFFLSFLGPRFLKEFYTSFVFDPAGIGFVAQNAENKKVCGVIVGPSNPAGYFKRLIKRRWWAFCLASLNAIFTKPSTVPRLWRAVFYRGDVPSMLSGFSLLSSIAVSPDNQARGIGRVLVNAFIDEVKHRGGNGVFLATDAEDNENVNRFYVGIGFTLEAAFTTPEGRKMYRYFYEL
jgi:GNAT superfamily N-acetyltransferase